MPRATQTVGTVYYAIGDVHGERGKLERLLSKIDGFHAERFPDATPRHVLLGDLVDKGPDSAGVVALARRLEAERNAVVIKGNHEALMCDAQAGIGERALRRWLENGGRDTHDSYDGDRDQLAEDVAWLDALPERFASPDGRFVFVHAGIDPERFPDGDTPTHLWTRKADFFDSETWTNPALDNVIVIHGHTPQPDGPDISSDGRRINVDTGACDGGPLTAAVLTADLEPEFLSVD